jgi:hypothetical protein
VYATLPLVAELDAAEACAAAGVAHTANTAQTTANPAHRGDLRPKTVCALFIIMQLSSIDSVPTPRIGLLQSELLDRISRRPGFLRAAGHT